MSEETLCFSASLYVDGQQVGEVINYGHGGPNCYRWKSNTIGASVETWAKTQKTKFDFEKLDQLIDPLISQAEFVQAITKKIKKATWFRVKGDERGAWRTINAPFSSVIKSQLIAKYGDCLELIVNEDVEAAIAFA